jgi:predicted amidohydrolase
MQDLKIALVQANQVWENKSANFSTYEKLLDGHDELDVIVLPEMFHTGFSMEVNSLSETMSHSSGLDWLKKMAYLKNAAIYTSLIIHEEPYFFNRGIFVFPDGTIEYYDKLKSFGLAGEDKTYTAGTAKKIVTYKGWKIQLQICYDLRFPEICRNDLTADSPAYDILLFVANWPSKRSAHWKALLTARAIENQAYVAGVNRVGTDGNGLEYSGDSLWVDALGEKQHAEAFAQEVKIVQAVHNDLLTIRKALPFLKDA